jgi:uncharacterized protein (TIGR00251 family)
VNSQSLRVRESGAGLEVTVHVQVRARRNEIVGLHNGALKTRIAAPPVDNAANVAIVRYFSSLLAVPASRVHVVSGMKSREKVLMIERLSLAAFLSVPDIRKSVAQSS